MLLWFVSIGVLGALQIARHPGVLAALSPLHAASFFVAHPTATLTVMASVFLALTGAEALYADMGHFGRRPIQVAWFWLVMPCLVLNYFGQGSLVLESPGAIRNPFFLLAPGMAATAAGVPRDGSDGHRFAGRHLRRVLDHQPGDQARLSAANGHSLHVRDGGGADLRSGGQLAAAADGQRAGARIRQFVVARRGLWRRGRLDDGDHDDGCRGGRPLSLGLGAVEAGADSAAAASSRPAVSRGQLREDRPRRLVPARLRRDHCSFSSARGSAAAAWSITSAIAPDSGSNRSCRHFRSIRHSAWRARQSSCRAVSTRCRMRCCTT